MKYNDSVRTYSIRDFAPLIIIFTVIILLTIVKSILVDNTLLMVYMMNFMGFFFLVFGLFKIFNLKNFAQAYSMYDLIAKRSKFYAYSYPFIEVVLGVLYLLQYNSIIINSVTIVLMSISALGVAYELSQGKKIVCACLGTVFKIPMTYVTLAEDLLMVIMALVMIFLT